jgi:hypothetical protein
MILPLCLANSVYKSKRWQACTSQLFWPDGGLTAVIIHCSQPEANTLLPMVYPDLVSLRVHPSPTMKLWQIILTPILLRASMAHFVFLDIAAIISEFQ